MKLTILLLSAVLVGLQVEAVKFGPLCSRENIKRGCDDSRYGCGDFGASRDGGKRKHLGLDIACTDGATVKAPFDVKINGKSVPKGDNSKIDDGIRMEGERLCFKMFYLKPVKYSGTVKKGETLGTMLPMQSVYPGITSHIHIQMCDKSDPTKYF